MSLPPDLLDGYRRFATGRLADQRERYLALALEGQKPRTMVIACADSRAAPETIFDAGPGELFVVRNVANLVPAPDAEGEESASAAVEYAIVGLGVERIVVLGHARCGGIAASLDEGLEPLSEGDHVRRWIAPLREDAARVRAEVPEGERQAEMERRGIRASVERLRAHAAVREAERAGTLTVLGAWFDIENGDLWAMDADGEFALAVDG